MQSLTFHLLGKLNAKKILSSQNGFYFLIAHPIFNFNQQSTHLGEEGEGRITWIIIWLKNRKRERIRSTRKEKRGEGN